MEEIKDEKIDDETPRNLEPIIEVKDEEVIKVETPRKKKQAVLYEEVILETQMAFAQENIDELPFCDSDYEEV